MVARERLREGLADHGSSQLLALGICHKFGINVYHGIVISMKGLLGYLLMFFQLSPSNDKLIQHRVVVVV